MWGLKFFPKANKPLAAEEEALMQRCLAFRRAMRVTAGARFNASKRLFDHDKRLNISVAILSFYIISLTVFQAARPVDDIAAQNLSIASIIVSLGVLVLALLQYASSDAVHAEQHHRCALAIEEVRRSLDILTIRPNARTLAGIVCDYDEVLRNSNLNHDEDDKLMYICSRPDLGFNFDRIDRFALRTRVIYRSIWPYLIVFIFGVATIWLIFGYAMKHLKAT